MVRRVRRLEAQAQVFLAPGHGEVHLGQDFSVEQCAVQRAAAVVHLIALAQGIQAVALPGVKVSRQLEGIEHADVVVHAVVALKQ